MNTYKKIHLPEHLVRMPRPRDVLRQLKAYKAGEHYGDAIKLSSNENVLGPSPRALSAIKRELERVHYYPEGSCAVLRNALAKLFSLRADHFIVGNGSDEILQFAAAAFLNEGEETLIAEHTFSQYEFVTRIFGGVPVKIPMQRYYHDLDATLAAVTEHTKIIFLCSPNNPTGNVVEDLVGFLKKVRRSVLVVVDQAYIEYADPNRVEDAIPLTMQFPNLLVLRTFSKIYGLAGLRIGYGVGDPRLIAALHRVRFPFNVGTLAQRAAEAALGDHDFVDRSLAMNREGKALLEDACSELDIPFLASEGNFLCLELPFPAEEFCSLVKKRGITVRDLNSFGLPSHIRISVGIRSHMQRFIDALTQILSTRST